VSRRESDLATLARDDTFLLIRAGVVGWRGSAILIPAARGSGTSTLVGELVRSGAQCYSDDWALLDEAGNVRPFSRPITLGDGARDALPGSPLSLRHPPPLRVALVVATTYRPGCAWEPRILQGARALLPVVDNAALIREQAARVLRLARALGSSVVTLESPRPDAAAVAPAILDFADAVLIRRAARSRSAREKAAPTPPQASPPPRETRPQEILASERTSNDPVTTYTVGGMPRSGTSMMMRALAAGGLEMFADTAKDERLSADWAPRRAIGYDPNPHGCHEPGAFRSHDQFPEMIRGRLVKLMGNGVAQPRFARVEPIRVAFICRDREAVARSHLTAFGRVPKWTETSHGYRRVIDTYIARQRRCPWVQDVTCFAYEDVVRDPLGQFSRLAAIGWPIDQRAAAATVDPTLERNRGSDHGRARMSASAP